MTEAIYLEVAEKAETAHKAGRRVSVSGMLKYLGVSRSGYRAWLKHVPSNAEQRRETVKAKIKDIYDESKQNYGAPKITKELRKSGEIISERTVGIHHALEILAFFDRRAGDTLVGINVDHFPIRIAGDECGIILILHAVGVELILTGGADAGIRCDAQFSCDELIVCRDDYDTLLFQRKVSAGLLLCHVLTPLCSNTHYHTIGAIAMTKTEKNQA